jgi:hypothetical protein
VPREVAALDGVRRRGGLVKLRRDERGGCARLTPARSLWGGGLCCVGRRVLGERKGRGGLPFDNYSGSHLRASE